MGSEALSRPPAGAFKLADRLAQESREFQRHKLTVEVEIQPVNHDFKPNGEPFVAVTQDISTGGIGFVHTRAVNQKLLCIALREDLWGAYQGQVLVLEVVRCVPVGSLYSVGGRFVAKIEDPRGEPIQKEPSSEWKSRELHQYVAEDVTTSIAALSDAPAEGPSDGNAVRKDRVSADGAHWARTWLAAGLVLAGVTGCVLFWVFRSTQKRMQVAKELQQQALLDEEIDKSYWNLQPATEPELTPDADQTSAETPASSDAQSPASPSSRLRVASPTEASELPSRDFTGGSSYESDSLLTNAELPDRTSATTGRQVAVKPQSGSTSDQRRTGNGVASDARLKHSAEPAHGLSGQQNTRPAADEILGETASVRSNTSPNSSSQGPRVASPTASGEPSSGDDSSSLSQEPDTRLAARELTNRASGAAGEQVRGTLRRGTPNEVPLEPYPEPARDLSVQRTKEPDVAQSADQIPAETVLTSSDTPTSDSSSPGSKTTSQTALSASPSGDSDRSGQQSDARSTTRELPDRTSDGAGQQVREGLPTVSDPQLNLNEVPSAHIEPSPESGQELSAQPRTARNTAHSADRTLLETPAPRSDLKSTGSVSNRSRPASRAASNEPPSSQDGDIASDDSSSQLTADELTDQTPTDNRQVRVEPRRRWETNSQSPLSEPRVQVAGKRPQQESTQSKAAHEAGRAPVGTPDAKPEVADQNHTDAELKSLYRLYATIKGWSTSKGSVEREVRAWQERRHGRVGLALKFFKTGKDDARNLGRNAEEAFKYMPRKYWPTPARQAETEAIP